MRLHPLEKCLSVNDLFAARVGGEDKEIKEWLNKYLYSVATQASYAFWRLYAASAFGIDKCVVLFALGTGFDHRLREWRRPHLEFGK